MSPKGREIVCSWKMNRIATPEYLSWSISRWCWALISLPQCRHTLDICSANFLREFVVPGNPMVYFQIWASLSVLLVQKLGLLGKRNIFCFGGITMMCSVSHLKQTPIRVSSDSFFSLVVNQLFKGETAEKMPFPLLLREGKTWELLLQKESLETEKCVQLHVCVQWGVHKGKWGLQWLLTGQQRRLTVLW